MKHKLPNHLKFNKKESEELKLMKERIKSIKWYEWFFIGLLCGSLLFLSFLL